MEGARGGNASAELELGASKQRVHAGSCKGPRRLEALVRESGEKEARGAGVGRSQRPGRNPRPLGWRAIEQFELRNGTV